MTKIIVHVDDTSGREAIRPAFLNGKKLPFLINTPFDATDELLGVLRESSLKVEVLPEGGSQSADPVDSEGAVSDRGGLDGAKLSEPVAEVPPVPEATSLPQLDHDGDGKAGGSLPKAKRTRKPAAKA